MKNTVTITKTDYGFADVYIAGCEVMARHYCMEFCLEGLCVNIKPCDFAYTGGYEKGVKIGLINYARFPSLQEDITQKAIALAEFLIVKLHQSSASVVAIDGSYFLSRRDT